MLSAFHAWTRTQPADADYNYGNGSACAFARFLAETGRETDPHCDYWGTQGHRISDDVADALHAEPRTFGKLAERLENLAVLA